METLLVTYKIVSAGDGKEEQGTNAFFINVASDREVYLIDVLLHPAMLRGSYSFMGFTGDRWVHLESPSSVIPVREQRISLMLYSCGSLPVVPLGQVCAFVNQSRRELYGDHAVISTIPNHGQQAANKKLGQQPPTANTSKATTTATAKKVTTAASSQKSPESEPQKKSAGSSKPANSSGSSKQPLRLEFDDATALAENAKETLGAAARTLFNFAAFAVKKAEDAVTSLSNAQVEHKVGHSTVRTQRILAEGGFGTVFLVQDTSNPSKQYAMKQLLPQSKEQVADAHNELQVLQLLHRSENVIKLLDHSSKTLGANGARIVLFLFPLYQGGTIWNLIERANEQEASQWPFTEARALRMLVGIARGLQAMHDFGWAHADVKPHNVLISDDDTPILMDLGSATRARKEIQTRQQALNVEEEAATKTSMAYRAPELTSTPYPISLDERVDVFGLGCTLYCIAFGNSPFETPREGVSKLAILNGKYSYPNDFRKRDVWFSETTVDLIDSMLSIDIANRPFTGEVEKAARRALDSR